MTVATRKRRGGAPQDPGVRSKHAKYASSNPISRYLVGRLFDTFEALIEPLGAASVLDVGCGEGFVMRRLEPVVGRSTAVAVDYDPVEARDARRNIPYGTVMVGDGYRLPFGRAAFDLVLSSQMLEHVERPTDALREMGRVAGRHVLLSVPREPIWRMLNVARGAYIKDLGNTPGHINHWSAGAFEALAARHFDVIERRTPLPWTVLLCAVRKEPS